MDLVWFGCARQLGLFLIIGITAKRQWSHVKALQLSLRIIDRLSLCICAHDSYPHESTRSSAYLYYRHNAVQKLFPGTSRPAYHIQLPLSCILHILPFFPPAYRIISDPADPKYAVFHHPLPNPAPWDNNRLLAATTTTSCTISFSPSVAAFACCVERVTCRWTALFSHKMYVVS